jgi:hypothetical protein
MLFLDLFFIEFPHSAWLGGLSFIEKSSIFWVLIDLRDVFQVPQSKELLPFSSLAYRFDLERSFFILLQFLYVLLGISPIALQSLFLASTSHPNIDILWSLDDVDSSRV